MAGNQNLEAYRLVFPWEMRESSGRNENERDVASKERKSEGRARNVGAKTAWLAETD